MARDDVFVQIRLPANLAEDLRELAKRNRVSVSKIVGEAVGVLFNDRDLRTYQQYLGLPGLPETREGGVRVNLFDRR